MGACFRQNLAAIASAAYTDPHATYGINKFTDLCEHEFRSQYLNLAPKGHPSRKQLDQLPFATPPRFPESAVQEAANVTVDWRTKGAVTPVKDQGNCGGCWAFSATGNMEGQHFLATGKLVSLSEEQLIQCGPFPLMGCNGGLMELAFFFVYEHGGINSEANYPYTSGGGTTGSCDEPKNKVSVAAFDTFPLKLWGDEAQMATWVAAHGPLSVGVDAGSLWQHYKSGIKTTCVAGRMDHGVLIVGYGTEAGVPYWIIKNSWNTDWGEAGYIRLKRGVNCNSVAENACSSVVKKA
eukprot:NODE_868_length_1150_cov_169.381471_g606_i0.p2 GENE.NODE_868_length_1150_cov_169.381471_g606_i0~~NODE_868_length_1150_cov_169.381471_g606_i0.p2  ORF type:complete len:294 (-),score=139.82 NODE_868_length_1150_cov_169.381471_g606_i0:241-1122(-)